MERTNPLTKGSSSFFCFGDNNAIDKKSRCTFADRGLFLFVGSKQRFIKTSFTRTKRKNNYDKKRFQLYIFLRRIKAIMISSGGNQMNERIRRILTRLVKKPETKMAELTTSLSLTRRQINYSIKQFNEELLENGLPQIRRNHMGDFIIPLEVLRMISLEQNKEDSSAMVTIFSEYERIAIMLSYLCTNTGYIGMDHFTQILSVSRNTIQEDLKKAKQFVSKYALSIHYDRQSGYQLQGLERRILQLLSDLIKQHSLFRLDDIKGKLAPTIPEEEVVHLIHNMEQLLHLRYSDESIDYLQSAVRMTLQRATSPIASKDEMVQIEIRKTPEYKVLTILLQDTPWSSMSPNYLSWLALLFLTSNIFERKTTQVFDSDSELRCLISEMVTSFQNQTLIMIEDREAFERRILGHLRPACFRIKYNLSLGMYSLDSLVQDSNHAILKDLMKELIVPTENWLGRAFPNDELALLSYYFGFQLMSPRQIAAQLPRAVVVCANGVMVSKLMRENLKKLFPELHFLASFSVRDFYKFGTDYDLVFTTTALNSELPQFIIDPIMTYKQQISLRYRVLKELGLNEVDRSVDELFSVIRTYAQVNDTKQLREELEYFLLKQKQDSPLENFKALPSLTDYLKPDFIRKTSEKLTWQQAVKFACHPLLENQMITELFIQDCLDQIEEQGYAGYLGSQTCIPHTAPQNGVLKDGISLLIAAEPIAFPNGKKIHFIYPLSFYDLTKHLKAVNQLADISNDSTFLNRLKESSDTKTAYQLIRQVT